MLISTEKEEISLPLDDADDAKELMKSSSMESNADSLDRLPSVSELPDSPLVPIVFTNVNVVPEHEKTEPEQLTSNLYLEEEIAHLKLQQRSLDEKRRQALNKILDIRGRIRVFCRVRPFLLTEKRKIHEPVSIGLKNIVVKSAGWRKEFGFDKVFHQAANQEDIFTEVEPILRSALDGHNVCVLAYGQTGTGKTFTMDGTNDQPGIVSQALELLFHQASLDNSCSITFSISMLEIYMGNLKDLLAPKPAFRANEAVPKCNLNIQTDSKGFVKIKGLTEVQIPDAAKARWWYNKGRQFRSTSWTNVNEASSRSHCLTRITVFRRGDTSETRAEVSKLWMIDLGGSERLLKTGATGQTLDEGRAVNLSLSALGDVIAALRRKKGHVPYRNSKLTQILKDSLGNGSKVLMLLHISPCEEDVAETICSSNFTKRARAVEFNRELTEDMKLQREKRIAELEEHMREAEEECQKIRNRLQKVEFLLKENKKIFSANYPLPGDRENNPKSPKEVLKEVIATTRVSKKPVKQNLSGFVPRFMTSTVASRQRQSASEMEIVGRARSFRPGTRSSVQFSTSQSFSLSDPRYAETNTLTAESPKCNGLDSKTASLQRSKMVTCSEPNLRVILCHHRRRMSDLI